MTILEPHLDVDQLSAAVDDAGDPVVAAHMLVCLACRQQVDTWRGALALLRSQPTPPPDVDPVAAAMAAWIPPPQDAQTVPEGAPVPPEAAPAEPVGAEALKAGAEPVEGEGGMVWAGAVDGDSPTAQAGAVEGEAQVSASPLPPARPGAAAAAPVEPGPIRRRHRLLRPRAGVAAALVAVVVVAAAVVGIRAAGSGNSGSSQTASRAAVPPAHGASSPSTLATGATAPKPSSASSGVPAATSPSAGTASESPSFAGTAQLAADLRQVVPAQPAVAVQSDTPCWSQARVDVAEIPAVTTTSPSFTETVTLVGVPGRVFVFALTHGQVAVVVRSSTCSLLATVQF